MRAIFFTLLLANLVFLAWANLIDVQAPPPNDALGQVPRLELMTEASAQPARGTAPADIRAPAANAAPTATKVATPADVIDRSSAAGPPGALGSPAAAPTSRPVSVVAPGTPATGRVSMPGRGQAGPAQGPGQRQGPGQGSGHGSRQGPSQGAAQEPGYWVFIGGLESQPQAEGVLRRLERNGISDAKIMHASDTPGVQVSVGLFSKRADAERRARAVRRVGLDAEIDVLQQGVTDRVARAASGGRQRMASAPF